MQIGKRKIWVVDDEEDIRVLVQISFEKEGFSMETFSGAVSFYKALESAVPDLLILDIMFPDGDGLDICRTVKRTPKYNRIPIIMLSARSEETDKVLGLELGADDYVPKPFSTRELVARAKALFRRLDDSGRISENDITTIGKNLVLNPLRYEADLDGRKLDLTLTEFRILHLLAMNKGWTLSRDRILDYLWGHDKAVIDRTIDVHIAHIRDKLGDCGKFIKNIRGIGYMLDEK